MFFFFLLLIKLVELICPWRLVVMKPRGIYDAEQFPSYPLCHPIQIL